MELGAERLEESLRPRRGLMAPQRRRLHKREGRHARVGDQRQRPQRMHTPAQARRTRQPLPQVDPRCRPRLPLVTGHASNPLSTGACGRLRPLLR